MRLERALADTAAERGLRRTLMRALALRVRLHAEARDSDGAHAASLDYLALYARTDYARPLVRIGAAARPALERVAEDDPAGPLAAAAERFLAMGPDGVSATPRLTAREKIVLRRLVTEPDKRIAAELGMTPSGVCYHIRGIFRKLGVRRRADAVRRARALGILSRAD